MKGNTCPNPGYLLFSLTILASLSYLTVTSSISSQLLINSYLFLSFICIVLCLLVFMIDASKTAMGEQRPLIKFKIPYRVCETCKINIYENTQHCSQCGVCIPEFQNHCIFLSTCIGKNNKELFYILLFLLQIWCFFGIFIGFREFFTNGAWWDLLLALNCLIIEGYLIIVTVVKIFLNNIHK